MRAPRATDGLAAAWESAGRLPAFRAFGSDLNVSGNLERAAEQISFRREIILVCGDGSAYASPTALNTVLQFRALRLHHVLYVSDSAASCDRLARAVPGLACAWSSYINTSKPAHDSVLVRKWWDYRFYFYNIRAPLGVEPAPFPLPPHHTLLAHPNPRSACLVGAGKHLLSRLAGELGYNVLQTDTDVAFFANPYPALKRGVLAAQQLVAQPDKPIANAGVIYAQNVAPDDAAAWVLRETIARVSLFSFHPEAVPAILPWASPPYFSNADEQSILNPSRTHPTSRKPAGGGCPPAAHRAHDFVEARIVRCLRCARAWPRSSS